MEPRTCIHFVRHGEVWNERQLYYGRLLGFPLSDTGRRQARATMDYLQGFPLAAVYSSPRLRAHETARIITAPHANLFVITSDLLDEACTPYDGQPRSLVEALDWDVYSSTGPGYETPLDVRDRVNQFVSAVRVGHSGQSVVAATHGDVIAFAMLVARNLPCTHLHKQKLYAKWVSHASVTTLTFESWAADELPLITYIDPFDGDVEPVVFEGL